MDALPILRFVVVERIPYALAAALLAWMLARYGTRGLEAMSERFVRQRLLFKQLTAVLRFGVLLGAIAVVAGSVFQLTDEVMLALGGSAAVAIGFAFKDLLASLMAGVILLFDRPFQVGDRIHFDGEYGEVMEIGLRTVRLKTLDDGMVSIPNNRFLSDVVTSANAGELNQLVLIDIFLACDQDFDTAREILYEAVLSSRFAYPTVPIRVNVVEQGIENAEQFAIRLSARAHVFDARFERAFRTDVVERVKRALRARGIRTAGEAAGG